VETVYALGRADRIPFVPAIYEHKGALVGKSPSEICRNPEYLYAGLRRELELYDPDMLVIGIDVYNVEAEALGCRWSISKIPTIARASSNPLSTARPLCRKLGVPDPTLPAGCPCILEVADRPTARLDAPSFCGER